MLELRKTERFVSVFDRVTCNRCGRWQEAGQDVRERIEFVEIKAIWGYFSHKYLEAHRSHLCEDCYDQMVAKFAIPPEIREYEFTPSEDPFANDPPLE